MKKHFLPYAGCLFPIHVEIVEPTGKVVTAPVKRTFSVKNLLGKEGTPGEGARKRGCENLGGWMLVLGVLTTHREYCT